MPLFLGKPLYQLQINLEYPKGSILPDPGVLSCHHHAYNFAEEYFQGWRYVTTKGYLSTLKENENEDDFIYRTPRSAVLNLEQNLAPLMFLRGVTKKEISSNDAKMSDHPYAIVTLVYSSPETVSGDLEFVKAEGSRLYLPLVRERISHTVNYHIEDLCSKAAEAARQVKSTEEKQEPAKEVTPSSGK